MLEISPFPPWVSSFIHDDFSLFRVEEKDRLQFGGVDVKKMHKWTNGA